jgi:FdhD protein
MENETETLSVLRVTEQERGEVEDIVVREFPLTIFFNSQELVTLLCSPTNLKYLAVGFLLSEGLIHGKDDIKNIVVDSQRGMVRVQTAEDKELTSELLFKRLITSGCGKGASFYSIADAQGKVKVESQIKISALEVFSLVKEFQHCSRIYRTTGGVHSAALCDKENILVFSEDIGRHNAIDKIFGECILNDIPTEDRIVITSGRVSSEILIKVNKRSIPVLVSKSAPTDLGVKLADDLGVTLIGFVRGKRMNVYANDWRIVADAG